MASQMPADGAEKTTVQQVARFCRRPLLHVLVIYASNHKVMGYALRTAAQFTQRGIDVYVQVTPSGAPKSNSRDNGSYRFSLYSLNQHRH
jgi:hypothetical protein